MRVALADGRRGRTLLDLLPQLTLIRTTHYDCTDPRRHQAIAFNLIDYTESGKSEDAALYRELYQVLLKPEGPASRQLRVHVGRLKVKEHFALILGPLYLQSCSTECRHYRLIDLRQNAVVPAKEEVESIFTLVHRTEHSWRQVKAGLIANGFHCPSALPLYKGLCTKCTKCVFASFLLKNKRALAVDAASEIQDPKPKRAKWASADAQDAGTSPCSNVQSKVAHKVGTTAAISQTKVRAMRTAARTAELFSPTSKLEDRYDPYPLKAVQKAGDKSWIGPLVHLCCSIPEIAHVLLANKTAHCVYDVPSLAHVVREYWNSNAEIILKVRSLRDFIKRLNRDERCASDFWQTLLSLALKEASATNPTENTQLGSLFYGEIVTTRKCWHKTSISNPQPLLYIAIRIAEDTNLLTEMIKQFFPEVSECKLQDPRGHAQCKEQNVVLISPLLLAIVVDREDLAASIELPLELDLRPFLGADAVVEGKDSLYTLHNVVCSCVHVGETAHYFSYILNPINRRWYRLHDSVLEAIPPETIDFTHACFALYRKESPIHPSILQELTSNAYQS